MKTPEASNNFEFWDKLFDSHTVEEVLMAISAKYNIRYGGNLINQKYSPLDEIVLHNQDANDYRRLFENREAILISINAYRPNTLNFYSSVGPNNAPNLGQAPMVVVSSNRANWMGEILKNASQGNFTGYLDNQTFNHSGIVPWYAPLRSNKQLYVVVHFSEYDHYQQNIGQLNNVNVIGYKFTATRPSLDIVGFGASRFAAIQAMISLGYQRAWVVDDNVVNINGFPNTLGTIEQLMTNTIWGIGFRAATEIYRTGRVFNEASFQEVLFDFNAAQPDILQQAVLWNLNLLRTNNINFSPLFVASNEDTSLSKYLMYYGYTTKKIQGLEIIKALPEDEVGNLGGKTEVPKRRNRIFQIFNQIEDDLQINTGNGIFNLANLINTGMPNSKSAGEKSLARVQAVEQIMSQAITINPGCYPTTVFNPYNIIPPAVPPVQFLTPAQL